MLNQILIDRQRALWKQMHEALDATHYRIQGQGYGNPIACNYTKPKDGPERLWSFSDVRYNIYKLNKDNKDGPVFNIYCLPVTDNVGYLLVDDVKDCARMLEMYGKPSVILESSENNYQMIYRVKIPDLHISAKNDARQRANDIMRKINKEFGDENICGIFHQFRMPGFANVKQGRNNWEVQLIEANKDLWNEKMAAEISKGMKTITNTTSKQGKMPTTLLSFPREATAKCTDPDFYHIYKREFNRHRGIAIIKQWNPDPSIWDFKAIYALIIKGCSEAEIAEAIKQVSPEIETRHSDLEDYIKRTTAKAKAKIENSKRTIIKEQEL